MAVIIYRKKISKEQALQKAKHFCAYQERCHLEVAEKMYSFGLWKNEVQEIIALMIEQGDLNEERFAISFARGRFSLKKWGRLKIKYALKQKKISDYCIRQALEAIDPSGYRQTFEELARKKWAALKEEDSLLSRKRKAQDYLLQKGFEHELIGAFLKEQALNP